MPDKKFTYSAIKNLFIIAFIAIIGLKVCDILVAEQNKRVIDTIRLTIKELTNGKISKWFKTLDDIVQTVHKKLNAKEVNPTNKAFSNITQRKDFEINPERGFWSGNGSVNKHVFDEPLAKGLYSFFRSERAVEIIDLGGGMGKYTDYFCSRDLLSRCYDGNPDSQEISNGTCAVLDFTKKIHFLPFDWVLTLEVGEHLPVQHESMYFGNIDRLNKKGAVLSWAVIGQGGSGHVNNRNNSYIIDKMKALKYSYDTVSSEHLRKAAFWSWFKNTLMVFRK